MQKRIGLTCLAMALFVGGSGLAQDTGAPLALEDCIQLALEKNSTFKQAQYNVELAEANVLGTWSNILPQISASFSSGRYIQGDRVRKMDVPVDVDPETGQVIYAQRDIVQEGVERNSHYARLSVSQNLFDWGQNFTLRSQASASHSASELTLVSTRQSVILDVEQKYFELLKAIKLLEVYQESVKSAEEQLKRTESMYEIGSVAQADVYKARVTLGNEKINLIYQENEVKVAKGNLNVAMGRDPNADLRIIEIEPEVGEFPYSMEETLRIALENNPELHSLEQSMRSAKLGMRAAKLAFLPSFGVGFAYSRDNEVFGKVYTTDLNRDYSISFGMEMDLNIFRGFADKAALDRESVYYKMAREDHTDKHRQLLLEVDQAFLYLKAMREIAEINKDNLVSAEEDLRLAEERYRVGAGTLLEINDARVAVTQAKQILISAKYDTEIAKASLEAIMGVLGS